MVDYSSAIVLAALINAIPATMLAWHKIQTNARNQNPFSAGAASAASSTENPAQTCQKSASSARSTTRWASTLLPLLLIAWGQLGIAAALWVDGAEASLTVWSLSFVGQGLLMLLLGFWLLLRD
jgi:hypothetical protein